MSVLPRFQDKVHLPKRERERERERERSYTKNMSNQWFISIMPNFSFTS